MQKIFNIKNIHRKYDDNGYLFVDQSPILRSGILEYLGEELIDGGSNYIDDVKIEPDKIYKVFLPVEELEKAKDSFTLIPIVNDHTWLGNDGKDAKNYQEGMTGETSYIKDGKLYVSMKFTGKGIINDIETGKEELSASYTNILSASNNPDYDFIATDYKGNHIALVDRGRCGEDVRVLNQRHTYPPVSDRDKAIALGIAVMIADAYLKAQNNFKESEHPRDDDGKFTEGTGISSSKTDKNETNTKIDTDISKILGTEYKNVKGQDAVNLLIKKKEGWVPNAFTRKDIGNIALIWGDEKKGLCHIIKRRKEQGINTDDFLSNITDIIEKGDFIKTNKKGRYEIKLERKVAVVEPEIKNGKMTFILTAYKGRG